MDLEDLHIFFRMFCEKKPVGFRFTVPSFASGALSGVFLIMRSSMEKEPNSLGKKSTASRCREGVRHLASGWWGGRFFFGETNGEFRRLYGENQTFFKDFPMVFEVQQQGVMSDFFLQRLEDHFSEKVGVNVGHTSCYELQAKAILLDL